MTRTFSTQRINIPSIAYEVPSEFKKTCKHMSVNFLKITHIVYIFREKKKKKNDNEGGADIQHGTELLFGKNEEIFRVIINEY